ncbi:MAG: hypothetical protein ACI9N9_001032 [Enterobacterales bacterium]|jgi:hypothetical protein
MIVPVSHLTRMMVRQNEVKCSIKKRIVIGKSVKIRHCPRNGDVVLTDIKSG